MTAGPLSVSVSVVIPAYNQARLLARLLDSLAAMTDAPPWDVIVVDDASPDNTETVVAAWMAAHADVPCRYLRQSHNQGPGAARNRGVEAARGELVAFTDTDCVVDPHWLVRLVAAVDGDPIAGAGGPVAPLNPGSIYALYNTVNASLEPQLAEGRAIPYLVTCNCCYRRAALMAAGGFPADIPTPGGEDVGASIALYKQGYRFAFAPEAWVQHEYRENWRRFIRTWTNYGYGCGIVAHRLLSADERDPEGGRWEGDNHWSVLTLRPTVTGLRSLIKDLRWFRTRCTAREVAGGKLLPLLALRAVERVAYYCGWKKGVKRIDG